MKRTMAAVIVGPTIQSPDSVFASEHEGCGTSAKKNWLMTEAIKAKRAEQGFEIKAVDRNAARRELNVNPQTGMPLKPESRREDRF